MLLFCPINSLAPDTCPGPLPIPKARWATSDISDLWWAAQNILGDSSAKSKCQWNNCGTIPSYIQIGKRSISLGCRITEANLPSRLALLTVNPQWVSDVHFLPGNKSVKSVKACVDVAGPHQLWCQPRIATALLLSKNKHFVINSLKHHSQILFLPQLFPLHGLPHCLCLDTNIFIWREALLYRHISLPLPSIHKGLSSGQEHLTSPHFIFAWLSAELSQCLLDSVWNHLALSISLLKDSYRTDPSGTEMILR